MRVTILWPRVEILKSTTTLDQVTMYQTYSELNCLRTVISTSKKEINTKMYSTRSCEIVPQGSCWLHSSPQAEWIKYLQNDYSDILFLLKRTIRNKYSKCSNSRTRHPTLNVPRIANSAWWLLTALKRFVFPTTSMWSQNNHLHHFQISGTKHLIIHWERNFRM